MKRGNCSVHGCLCRLLHAKGMCKKHYLESRRPATIPHTMHADSEGNPVGNPVGWPEKPRKRRKK